MVYKHRNVCAHLDAGRRFNFFHGIEIKTLLVELCATRLGRQQHSNYEALMEYLHRINLRVSESCLERLLDNSVSYSLFSFVRSSGTKSSL